ncbi:YdcF family protein [Edaphobacter bradus]|uniref:YdcF family protein n=1 Tax=Edaphobacter bradus TaxID=2259016 RepID=UPI0021DF4A7F|nr:YdcF family protein [Edaphobacter bradus]
MIVPASNLRRRRSSSGWTALRRLAGIVLVVALAWSVYVYHQIAQVAHHDDAQPADAIAVFGAAEYLGRPSPVLHARLDHAVDLYRKQIAPLIITLGGGSDRDSGNTEGAVGRDYLLANGVPFGNIIAETRSTDTEQQVRRLAAIARDNNLHHVVVVSDGTHLFRIRELCSDAGLDVYTSPRPALGHISSYDLAMRYFHEIISYTMVRLHLDESWLHWVEGKEDF